jgi:carboxyl-terminal processing protease
MSEINNSPAQIRLPLLLAIAVSAGILIGAAVIEPDKPSADTSGSIAKFREVVVNIDRNYVDEVDITKMVDGAIIKMLKELDPHTSYMSVEEHKRYADQLKGSYDGIGIQYNVIRDTIVVVKPAPGGPSAKAGIQIGDRIVKVEDEIVANIGIDTKGVTSRLLGPPGSVVQVTVVRPGENEPITFSLRRSSIGQSTVAASYMLDGKTGYIKLSRFGANSYKEFKQALSDLIDQDMQQLVLDLQGNGGGYMLAAQQIADELISGDPVIVSQKGKEPSFNDTFYASHEGIFEDKPTIVLIDEYSASASEIVAGALQDNDRALIVGRRSYGKGLVQIAIELTDGSELRLTTARYYTPSGRSIQKHYENGEELAYQHDIMDRYSHGEFFHSDSIQFNDSLKFLTSAGRTVYGGGGIMPDYFVPLDTTLNSQYYNALVNNSVIRDAAINYYLDHRQELQGMTFVQFKNNLLVTDEILEAIRLNGESLNVEFEASGLAKSKPLIQAFFKAELARSVFTDEEFYPIMNEANNEILLAALRLFPEAELLAQR